MAEARYPCPDCGATLKLANEVPAGKKIKCPKCQTVFAPVAEAKAKPKPAPVKPKVVDEDAGTYGVVSEPEPARAKKAAEDDGEEDKKSMHEEVQERLEKRFPKSKRGPAQALVTKAANQLLATSSLACVSCIVSVVVALWPMFFSKAGSSDIDSVFINAGDVVRLKTVNPDSPAAAELERLGEIEVQKDGNLSLGKYGTVPVGGKKVQDIKGLIKMQIEKVDKFVGAIDLQIIPQANKAFYWLWIAAAVAAFAYNGMIVYGAVSMQNVESYNWAMAGSFLMLAPSNWALFVPAFGWFLMFVKNLAGDELFYATIGVFSIWCLYVGIWNVMTLRNPEVEAGFREKKSEEE